MRKKEILLNTKEEGGERMSKVKYILFIVLFLAGMLLFFVPNSYAAEVNVTRNIYSNNGSMKFNFTGLTLDMSHDYEFGFTRTKTLEVEKWYLITEKTVSSVVVDIVSTDSTLRKVVDAVDTGYITIKDKATGNIVLEPYVVDLKVPFLRVTNYTVIPNGKEMSLYNSDDNNIKVLMSHKGNSEAYYQYEKITDQNVINKYKEIKKKNGNFMQLENILKTTVPTSNWKSWDFWNGYESTGGGYGYTQKEVKVPDSGLYYMWLYFSGKNGTKNRYAYILVDNLEPDIALESILLPKTATVEMGKTLNLNVNFNPENATNKIVTWSSSDESVATVDNVGRVTPKKIGSTIITVVSQDGNKKANCTVTVTTQKQNNNQGNENNNSASNGNGTTNNGASNNPADNNNDNSKNPAGSINIKNDGSKPNDPTTAKGTLPQTGEKAILLVVIVVAVLSGIGYVKYKKYQDIK